MKKIFKSLAKQADIEDLIKDHDEKLDKWASLIVLDCIKVANAHRHALSPMTLETRLRSHYSLPLETRLNIHITQI